MNKNPLNTGLEKVIFILEDENDAAVRQEISLALVNLGHDGVRSECLEACAFMPAAGMPELPENSGFMLFITDSPAVFKSLLEAGMCAAAWVHERPLASSGQSGQDFPGAQYLLEEPGYIDTDSYIKIYERLKGLPWTILETTRCMVRELESADAPGVLALYDDEALRYVEE
ncbi:MAG: hypothetical protein J6P87_00920, partial [Lachnospiraceae bacterium]|nr:hypothetical protein [Lachnospiraceae bacterium]